MYAAFAAFGRQVQAGEAADADLRWAIRGNQPFIWDEVRLKTSEISGGHDVSMQALLGDGPQQKVAARRQQRRESALTVTTLPS